MRMKKTAVALCAAVSIMTTSITAFAEDINIDTDVYQPDEISGYVTLHATTEADVYLKIYKITPDTEKEEYIVYDTKIEADTVHVSNKYIYELEYNNLDIDRNAYEGCYEIMVGVDRLASPDLEDIAYSTIKLIVEDENYCGVETFCNINVNITDEALDEPLCVESGDKYNKTYDITFSNIEILRGDANNDGKINVRDCAFIASKLAQGKTNELTPAADINGDGKVNVRDAAALASSLAGGNKQDPTEPATPTEPNTEPTVTVTTTTPVQSGTSTETTRTVVTDPTEPAVTETTASATQTVTAAPQETQTTQTTPVTSIMLVSE